MASRAEQQRRERRFTDAETWAKKQDDTGGDFERYFRVPDGVKLFKPKEAGNYRLHIIPYEVKQDHNPLADVGMVHPERTFYVHQNMGTSGKETYVCRASYHNERCPICEWIGSFGGQMDKERYGAVRQKTRQLWNLIDVTTPESAKLGIQVWETNYNKGFGEQLRKKILLVEGYRKFYRPEGGSEILITVESKVITAGRPPFMSVEAVEIVPRQKDYPDSIIDKAHDLDAMLVFYDYAQLKQLVEEGRIGEPKKTESNGHDTEHKTGRTQASRENAANAPRSRPEPEPEPEPEPKDADSYEPAKGDEVTFEYRGKVHEGTVTGVNKSGRLAKVDVDGRTRTVGFDDLSPKKDEPEVSGDGWDDGDGNADWDADPAPKKGGKATKPDPDDDWT